MAVAVVDVQVRSSGAVNSLRQINTASKEAQGALEGLKRAAAGLALVQVGRQALQAAASFNDLQLRLKLLTAQYGETAKVQQFAAESARRFGLSNREAAEGVTNIYARLKPLGVSLRDIQSTFTGFNTVARLSGATGAEASAAFTQLAQALGSGRLQGDEFRSIAEQVPGILVAISQQTGIAASDLKEYAKEGKLTSEVVVAALRRIETEGAGKIAQIIQQSDVQRFKDFQNAVDDLQIALGNELLPLVAPLVKDLTSLVRAITGLPEPVKNTTIELVRLGVQVLLVKKALEAIIAIRVALVGSLAASGAAAATSASAFSLYANNAKTLAAQSAAASGKVNPLVASLQSLAALGVITVAINLAVSGLQEFIQARNEINRLRGQREKGGAAAVFAEAAPAGSKQAAQATLKAIRQEQQKLQSPAEVAKSFLGPLAPLVGGMSPAARGERGILLKERAAFAQGVLGLPTRAEPTGGGAPPALLGETGGGRGLSKAANDAKRLAEELRRSVEQGDNMGREFSRQVLLLSNITDKEEERYRIQFEYEDRLREISELKNKEQQVNLKALNDEIKRLEFQKLNTEELKKQNDLFYQRAGLSPQILGAGAGAFRTDIDLLGQQEKALQAVLDKYPQIGQAASAASQLATEGTLEMINGTKTAQQVFADFLNSISDMLMKSAAQMIAQYIAIGVARMFAGLGGSAITSAGNRYGGSAFGGAGLGSAGFRLPFLGARANGGSVMAGQGYLVGERGPELFMPGRSGGIAPAGGFGGMGNVVVNVDAGGSSVQGDPGQASQLGKVIGLAVQQELIKQKRPGGLLS